MKHFFDILEYGAKADGQTLNTRAIQDAIDACHEAGGGQVLCGPGVFVTGAVELKNNVELHLSSGCRIVGSKNLEDYTPLKAKGFRTEVALSWQPVEKSAHGLIWAANAERIAVTGTGTIDGSGVAFYDTSKMTDGKFDKPETPRPRMVMFYQCRDIRLQDTTFVDSPCWTVWLMQCEEVQVQRITVRGNRQMRNGDGIDIDACRNVVVSDCIMITEDDCLILRAIQSVYDSPAVCENVTITNCVLNTSCQGVRVGCPGDAVIRNCTFSNLVIESTKNGILFENPRHYLPPDNRCLAYVENIRFTNVVVNCQNTPIGITVGEGIALPRLANLSFSDFSIRSGEPCLVQGSTETIIENVRFSNMRIETSGDDAILCRRCRGVSLSGVELSNCAERDQAVSPSDHRKQ